VTGQARQVADQQRDLALWAGAVPGLRLAGSPAAPQDVCDFGPQPFHHLGWQLHFQ